MGSSSNVVFLDLSHSKGRGNTSITVLRRKIRHAEEPDNPALISIYLNQKANSLGASTDARRQHLLVQFQLLLDTIMDTCRPLHWRCLCMDHIHQPIFALKTLADTAESKQHVRTLFHDLRICGEKLQADILAGSSGD